MSVLGILAISLIFWAPCLIFLVVTWSNNRERAAMYRVSEAAAISG